MTKHIFRSFSLFVELLQSDTAVGMMSGMRQSLISIFASTWISSMLFDVARFRQQCLKEIHGV
ncbi:hypothetical protein DBV39_08185 [Orrella marina]|uniref:Uncharacterized protein n=1 Tax=Orrella marina TaxID=2163011 RepID=A0A2R4XIP6_9BURK|nr:hypothetical protein DBV39_08185 [Orrella marina]